MSKRKKIALAGYGRVGKAVADLFRDQHDVLVYDPQYAAGAEADGGNVTFVSGIEGLAGADLGVICVPTPSAPDGSCDTSIVEDVVKKLDVRVILIKSTVAPTTTDRIRKETGKRIVFSPEYVGKSKYYNPYFPDDMKAVPFVILGGEKDDCNYVFDILVPILGGTKQYFKTSALNAELIKYMENAYFATKITFVNEMYEICRAFGADWYDVREGWLLDPRVGRMHSAAAPEMREFGGKCFPKDTSAIVEASKQAGYKPEFLEEMIRSNKRFGDMRKA